MLSWSFTIIALALSIAQGTLSIPLGIQPLADPANAQETENLQRITTANNNANKNILKMEHVLNQPNVPEHAAMINAAFGTDPSRDMNHIHHTVQALKTGAIPVLPASAGRGVLAYTQYNDHNQPTHVEFGNKFHAKGTSDSGRSATLIHEATHYLTDSGDYIHNHQMLKGSNPQTTSHTGYATGSEPKRTPAELHADKNWAKMRDGHQPHFGEAVPPTKDLHHNAESYAQFSSMCGAAIPDHVVGFRRALEERDYDIVEEYLSKRNKCSLPKDYFAKKAAAKKAATAKAAGVHTPAHTKEGHVAHVGRVASKAAAGKRTGPSKNVAGAHAGRRGSPKPVQKVAGSRRPASSKRVTKRPSGPAALPNTKATTRNGRK